MEKTINKNSFTYENPLGSKTSKGFYYAVVFSLLLHFSFFFPHFFDNGKTDTRLFTPVTKTVEVVFLKTTNTIKKGESKKTVIVKEETIKVVKKESFFAEKTEPVKEENILDKIINETFAKESVNVNAVQNEELALYKRQIQEKILKAKFYPAIAKRRNYEGSVGVKFSLNQNGQINDIAVVRPCHIDSLNKAAVKTVKDAAPFTAIPQDLNLQNISMELDIAYSLN